MRQKTVLALALLLTAPLIGLAATSEPPAPLAWLAAAPSDEATSCALSPSGAPEVSEKALNLLAVGEDALTCSSYCAHSLCRGEMPGTVCGDYPKVGDGRYRCYCKY